MPETYPSSDPIDEPTIYVSELRTFVVEQAQQLKDRVEVLRAITPTTSSESVDRLIATAEVNGGKKILKAVLDLCEVQDGIGEIQRFLQDES